MELEPRQIEHLLIAGGVATALIAIWTLGERTKRIVGNVMSKLAARWLKLSGYHEFEKVSHAKILTAMETLQQQLREVKAEFSSNGGTSMKDDIHKIIRTQAYQGAFQMSSLHTWEKAIFITDESGLCTYVNRTHSRLTGFRPDECMGNDWINVVHPSERVKIMKAWEDAVTDGFIFDMVITYIKPGNVDPYKVKVHAVKIESHAEGDDSIYGYMGQVTPIEEKD